jgi:predicted enzyme related to lactoylglutathione lyase
MHGFCHIEIPTTDVQKSKAFYGQLFGWEFDDMGGGYVIFKPPDGTGGGFTTERKPSEEGICLYIEVEDIPKKLEEIESAGGKAVTAKTKISDEFGFYAIFLDPQGNALGIWSKA